MQSKTSSLTANVIANFFGKAWIAIVGILAVPIYLRFLSIESYGLVGFYATLQSIFSLLDMGFGVAVNRELARLTAGESFQQRAVDLVRTLECFYWLLAGVIAAIMLALSPVLGTQVIKSSTLSFSSIQTSLMLMGFAVALQFPLGLYTGALVGLQRQVLLNAVNMAMTTLTALGAVLVLWLWSPTVNAFFTWELIATASQSLLTGLALWLVLHRPGTGGPRPHIDLGVFRGIWRFAVLTGLTAIIGALRAQMDKLVLIKLLPLSDFGYYSLATVAATGLFVLAGPVNIALLPRLSQYVAQGMNEAIRNLYHQASQLQAVAVLPIAALLVFFSREIMFAWTHDAVTADKTYAAVTVMTIGVAYSVLVYIPLTLQYAFGWTKLATSIGAGALPLAGALTLVLANRYGLVGAATANTLVNALTSLVFVYIIHRTLLKGHQAAWYLGDVFPVLAAVVVVAVPCRLLLPWQVAYWQTVLELVAIGALLILAGAMAAPYTRRRAVATLKLRLA